MVRPWRLALFGSLAALATVMLVYLSHNAGPQAVSGIVAGITNGSRALCRLGWTGFLLVQVLVAISGFLPASLVGISAGAAYGVTIGFTTASISILAGAVLAFLVSRSLLRPFIERKLRDRPRLAGLDEDIGRRGWRMVCLLRLSPAMPFAATSYALGLSTIGLRDYVIGTLASLPPLLGYVLAGALVKTGVAAWTGGADLIHLASLAIGTLSMAILLLQLRTMFRRARLAPQASHPRPAAAGASGSC